MTKGRPAAAGAVAIHTFAVNCAAAESRVRHMRRITQTNLRRWGLAALSDVATLAVSELVTNAVQHGGGGSVALRIGHHPAELLIEVTDEGRMLPVLREADENGEHGRGLSLIAGMAKEWGVSDDGGTKWCSLALPKTPGGRSEP
ncbi:ATP-binding protein [Streptomyces tsukubensis]|uniref:ATP-binding protein n=1 Tax=Streptomyces tsukubensis TaxID=83656 RepID=UPI00369A0582